MSNIDLHSTQAHGMPLVAHMPWPSFVSKRNDNSYSIPLLHEALDVDHKMVILGTGLYQNKFSHLCVQHHHYPEHNPLCLYILFHWFFFGNYPDQWKKFAMLFRQMLLELFIQTYIIVLGASVYLNLGIKSFWTR